MAIPNYTCLKLKMSGPAGTITMGTTMCHAYECEVECCDLAKGATTKQELLGILQTVDEQQLDTKRMGATFKLVNDMKEIPLDPECADRRTMRNGSSLPPKQESALIDFL